jgi:peptide/nickel transport system substrate-binding protein
MRKSTMLALGFAAALAMPAGPAAAQKSADTLRLAINDMFGGLDTLHYPHDEGGSFTRTTTETLLSYDERKHVFVPRLAKAWRRIDNRTLEFDLREDVLFHNGDKFTAEDVKYSIDYARAPETRIRFKERYSWVEEVQVLSPYKVRIVAAKPQATDLQTIAYRLVIFDAKVHRALENKADFGRAPVTTGPYKVTSYDPAKGIVLDRFDDYYEKSGNFRAPIKRVVGIPIPDRQTQVAQFITGGIDLLRDVPADTAREVAKMPNAKITVTPSGSVIYVTLDAAGRSANKAMTDVRVRKAFMMAIDRKQLATTVIPGGDESKLLDAICYGKNIACAPTVKPYPYNPAEAKKLMAEAGFANGLDLELNVYAPIREIGEAIAGQVRAVGFRASARPLPLTLYARMRSAGEMTAFSSMYPTAAEPDAGNVFDFFFNGDRDYWKDPEIHQAIADGLAEFDPEKRTAIYTKALNRVNELVYIVPLAELPTVWAHSKDVRVSENPLSAVETRLGDWSWN